MESPPQGGGKWLGVPREDGSGGGANVDLFRPGNRSKAEKTGKARAAKTGNETSDATSDASSL